MSLPVRLSQIEAMKEKLLRLIDSLKPNKSLVLDGIYPKVIKEFKCQIAGLLSGYATSQSCYFTLLCSSLQRVRPPAFSCLFHYPLSFHCTSIDGASKWTCKTAASAGFFCWVLCCKYSFPSLWHCISAFQCDSSPQTCTFPNTACLLNKAPHPFIQSTLFSGFLNTFFKVQICNMDGTGAYFRTHNSNSISAVHCLFLPNYF